MKKLVLFLFLGCLATPVLKAQEEATHIELGVYADYFRLSGADTNMTGVGARLGTYIFPHIKLEGEMAYDFDQTFGENITDTSGTIYTQTSHLRQLHGLFGPKFELGHSNFHPFVLVKGGFDKFFLSSCPPSFSCATSQISDLRSRNVNAVLYPGGGIEGHLGPVGLRLEAGDEMFFSNGTHHNLRMAFGPYITF
jgi:hypothetical protein